MHISRFTSLIALFLHTTVLFSQNIIKGMVCDTDGTTILNANIVLWHNDSIVAQSINSEHGFFLENVPDGSYILNVSHVGYQIKQIALDVKNNADLGSILLPVGYELDEIVVRSARNVTSYRNNLLHINVKQTYLSELPDVESVKKNIPGVLLTNNRLTYFGKGQILILINGREVKSPEEVNALQPSQISEIVVDNMPGAKYDPRYASVLNIKTTSESPALMIYNTDTWGRHYSGATGFTSQRRIGNVLADFGYSFRKRTNTLYSKQTEENLQADNTFERVFMDTTVSRRQSHDWHIGTQSKLKAGTLTLRYSGYYSSNTPGYFSFMQYVSTDSEEDFNIRKTGKYKERQHLATLDYMVKLKSENTFRITADYLNQYSKDNNIATEYSVNSDKQTLLDFQGKYNIYSLLTEYGHRFGKSVNLSVGARYSHVYNKDDSQENDVFTLYNLHENRYALYAEGRFQWQKMNLMLGLRGEKFDKRYRCTGQDATKYKDLFFLPSFAFAYQCSEYLQISLSGNNKVSLPSFNELTPVITYLNQYSYMTGNPLLKPTVRYDFSFGTVWQDKFNVKLEYSLVNLDQYLYRTEPSCFVQLLCNWKLGHITNFSIGYAFQSKSCDKADTYSATHNLGCNLSVVPIKNKLSLNLQINDILRKATGNWETKYGYIRTQQFNNADSRNITLSLRYIFNTFKSIRQGSSNREEIERLP